MVQIQGQKALIQGQIATLYNWHDIIVSMGKRKEDKMTKKTPEERMQEALDYIKEMAGMKDEK